MREMQVVVKCDICKEAKDLHWDGLPVTINGTDFLIDVCEFDAEQSERTLARFFLLLAENSRRADGKRKKKNKPPSTTNPQSPLVDCPHCGKQYRQMGMTLHITRSHPELKAAAA